MKPLLSLDIETTGKNITRDHIIQVGLYSPFEVEREWLIKPPVPIPPEITELTGITNEQVAKAWTFKLCANDILQTLRGADLLVFNGYKFDVPFLYEEFYRAAIEWDLEGVEVIDVGNIFKRKEERTLSAALSFYCMDEHDKTHRALVDCEATQRVFISQLMRYLDLRNLKVHELARYSRYNEDRLSFDGKIILKDGVACYNFGKNKGVPVLNDVGYALWMIGADFPAQTKAVLKKVLEMR